MKLYKTVGYAEQDRGDASNWIAAWDGTQADATACRKKMKADGLKDIETKDVDVPTNKAGLLAWLNENVTGE